ncbi:unnamed protein product [Chilo suppressalis]|uniref:Gustatory receptor n=1 Tax=Chilo suppressalis TaxID=168631 RepID=A0ABN8B611_CHISP|nr:unnamed protein product [Chilo suppressalis]
MAICVEKYTYVCDLIYLIGLWHFLIFDSILVFYSSIFYFAQRRLKILNRIVKNSARNVSDCFTTYKSIADTVDSIKTVFDYLYMIYFVTKLPELLWLTNLRLVEVKICKKLTYIWFANIINSYLNFIVMCAPAITAGVLTSEAKNLKIKLQERMMMQKGKHKESLRQLEEYVCSRPLKQYALQVVPLNWSLILILINFIVTYQITIVQFMHLF